VRSAKTGALILLGDFNIVSPEHRTMQALLDNGFVVPAALQEMPTTGTAKHYDQIAFKTKPDVIEYVNRRTDDPLQRNAGVVPIFQRVLAPSQLELYEAEVRSSTAGKNAGSDAARLRKAYLEWRTYQLSDHYPMWVRLHSDGSEAYLKRLAASP
jgi:hypothetical protein